MGSEGYRYGEGEIGLDKTIAINHANSDFMFFLIQRGTALFICQALDAL